MGRNISDAAMGRVLPHIETADRCPCAACLNMRLAAKYAEEIQRMEAENEKLRKKVAACEAQHRA